MFRCNDFLNDVFESLFHHILEEMSCHFACLPWGLMCLFCCLLGQSSLHSVDRTGKKYKLHFSAEGVKSGVGVEGY